MMLSEQLRQSAYPLNAIRFGLAITVIIAHSSPLSGFCCEPFVSPILSSGDAAVGAFFALSGLLVTMSAMRSSAQDYLIARVRRIFPAYILVLTVTAFILAPAIHFLTNGTMAEFSWSSAKGPIAYVVDNVTLSVDTHHRINKVFDGTTPYVGINGSIWTLAIEFRAYLLALFIVIIGKKVGLTRSSVFALLLTLSWLLLFHLYPALGRATLPDLLEPKYMPNIFVFLCGSVVATVAHRIKLTHAKGLAAIVILYAALQMEDPFYAPIGLGTLVIVLPYLASLVPARPFRWFANDLSYGTYLWGFPVAQTLAFLGFNSLGLFPFALLTIICTLPIAALSWFLVERRFLKRRA
jgi:peptidoglycan/LPS O-acetylase OafA/YrhL